jgi:hypothetical protein
MPDYNSILAAPCGWTVTATAAANTAATATKAAPASTQRHYICGVGYSASAAPSAAVEVLVKSGTTTIHAFQVPAAAFSAQEINFPKPLPCAAGELASVEIPALGGTTVGRVNLRGLTSSA